MAENILNPTIIAQKGERIYKDKYQKDLEKKHLNEFVAIDVETEKSYVGKTPEEALEKAKQENPGRIFHLIKIGSEGLFKMAWQLNSDIENAWCF